MSELWSETDGSVSLQFAATQFQGGWAFPSKMARTVVVLGTGILIATATPTNKPNLTNDQYSVSAVDEGAFLARLGLTYGIIGQKEDIQKFFLGYPRAVEVVDVAPIKINALVGDAKLFLEHFVDMDEGVEILFIVVRMSGDIPELLASEKKLWDGWFSELEADVRKKIAFNVEPL